VLPTLAPGLSWVPTQQQHVPPPPQALQRYGQFRLNNVDGVAASASALDNKTQMNNDGGAAGSNVDVVLNDDLDDGIKLREFLRKAKRRNGNEGSNCEDVATMLPFLTVCVCVCTNVRTAYSKS
jgi:hypothetical protein